MSALSKPNFYSASALNPTTLVNAELVASVDKNTLVDTVTASNSRYEIVFQYIQPYTHSVTWRYASASLRDTAFAAIKGAIATSST